MNLPKTIRRINVKYLYLACAVLGAILALSLYTRAFCLLFISYPAAIGNICSALVALISAVIGLLIKFKKITLSKTLEKILYMACWLLGTASLLFFGLLFFHQPDKNTCIPDFAKLVNLTNQEATAVITKKMVIIQDIYAPQAIVTDVQAGQSTPVRNFYLKRFIEADYCTVNHNSYEVLSHSLTEVSMTTGSQGTWGWAGKGCTFAFANPPGSDRWTFQKIDGKWKIVHFEFNIK